MSSRRPIAAFAAAALLAALAAGVFAMRRTSVETSVYAMLGKNAAVIPDDVRDESSRMVFVVFSSPSSSVSRAASEVFREKFQAGAGWHAVDDGRGDVFPKFAKRADGLVSDVDREALSTPEGRAKIARAAIRRYVASPIPPMFSPAEDPFCLKERFFSAFSDSPDMVVPLPLRKEVADDAVKLGEFKHLLDEAVAAALREADPSVRIMPCGVPLHTVSAVARCRRETGWLSLFSSVFILAVAFAAFRPLSRVAYPIANLVASASAGAIALFLFAPLFHVTTVLFGTAVLGLVADYSFHWLLCSPSSRRATVKNLAVSFSTTALSLVPLAFSSLPVLRESAVFLSAALATAFVFVVLTHPDGQAQTNPRSCPSCTSVRLEMLASIICVAIGIVAVFAVPRMAVKTDPAALYVPPKELLKPEKILASKWNPPSAEVTENVKKLYDEQGGKVADALGLARVPEIPARAESGVDALSSALGGLTDETCRRLLFSLLAMIAALAVIFRFGVFAAAAPSAFALFVAAGFVTSLGESINLFHLLAGFLLAGMCVDYAVFMRSGERGSMKSVTCSLLTSMAGFGALAFVSFPPAAAFGKVLGVGLPAGYLAAVALRRRQDPNETTVGGGNVEKVASPLGMEIIWTCYCVFGLGAMRFLAQCVAGCAWVFSPAVRRASPSRRKLLMFARSLADKVAIVSGRGAMPWVRGDGSDDVSAFAADVSSGRGVFVLSSHCGTVEALLVLAKDPPVFHAWTDLARTSVFNAFYLRHAKSGKVALHSIADIGVDTAFDAINWLDRGECLVMAGDKGRGAFRFAAALGHPVYFATCIAEGAGYVAVIRRLSGTAKEMEREFFAVLGGLAKRYPEQNYEWN